MPPDRIKSGILDEDGAEPVSLDISYDSNKIIAQPFLLMHKATLATCKNWTRDALTDWAFGQDAALEPPERQQCKGRGGYCYC